MSVPCKRADRAETVTGWDAVVVHRNEQQLREVYRNLLLRKLDPHRGRSQVSKEELLKELSQTMQSLSVEELAKSIGAPKWKRAHPKGLSLRLPGSTYTELEFVRDLIAQLFK